MNTLKPDHASAATPLTLHTIAAPGGEFRAASAQPKTAPRRTTPEPRADAAPWIIVLAGGEGRRLREFTRQRDGVEVPKQFCEFRHGRTLLGATLDRALALAPPERVVVVVLESHRRWWQREVSALPARNVLAQPVGRGTSVAILHAIVQIQLREVSPRVIVMPSDHDIEDEAALVRAARRAALVSEMYPADLALLGIRPSHLDSEYGLVTPGEGRGFGSRTVRAFVEKPSLTHAARLVQSGALWNSFIFACTGSALYGLLEDSLPSLVRAYLQGLAANGNEPGALAATFAELPECDFSRDVLQRNPDRLRLVEVPACGWTDLGTPARLAAWLGRHREAPFWREHDVPRHRGPDDLPGALQAGGA